MRALIALAMCTILGACAAVPKVDDTPSPQGPAPIVGAKGPLTIQQSRVLLDKLAPEPGDNLILKRHLAIEQAVAETPLVAGNSTRLLVDGEKTFPAMFALIQGAKETINLEYYILEDVAVNGQHLGDLLIAKRQEGVTINIIYDSYGSASTPSSFFQRLKDGGINLVDYNPVNPLDPIDLNKRDHRKILVADGARAIVGGVNLSVTYESSGSSSSGGGSAAGSVLRALDGATWSVPGEGPIFSRPSAARQRSGADRRKHARQSGPPLLCHAAFGDPQC